MKLTGKQRGPSINSREIYAKSPPHQFLEKIRATGKFAEVWNEETGQGVFVGIWEPKSYKTEGGRDVAIMLCEMFRGDYSNCCGSAVAVSGNKNDVTRYYVCKKCGQACDITQGTTRKPTYIPDFKLGGKRVKQWHQTNVQWSLIKGVAEAMLKLAGEKMETKIEMVKEEEKIKEEKHLTRLDQYDI